MTNHVEICPLQKILTVQILDAPTRPDHPYRTDQLMLLVLDSSFAAQRISNYTRYSTVLNSDAIQYV